MLMHEWHEVLVFRFITSVRMSLPFFVRFDLMIWWICAVAIILMPSHVLTTCLRAYTIDTIGFITFHYNIYYNLLHFITLSLHFFQDLPFWVASQALTDVTLLQFPPSSIWSAQQISSCPPCDPCGLCVKVFGSLTSDRWQNRILACVDGRLAMKHALGIWRCSLIISDQIISDHIWSYLIIMQPWHFSSVSELNGWDSHRPGQYKKNRGSSCQGMALSKTLDVCAEFVSTKWPKKWRYRIDIR